MAQNPSQDRNFFSKAKLYIAVAFGGIIEVNRGIIEEKSSELHFTVPVLPY